MTWLFSKRCQSGLSNGQIKVSIPVATRNRLWKAIQNYDERQYLSDNVRGQYETSVLSELSDEFKAELGVTDLMSFPEQGGDPKPGDLKSFVLRGTYPPHLIDIIELCYLQLSESRHDFQYLINQIMEEGKLSWRMANGKVFPVDPICEDIIREAYSSLHDPSFSGALLELEKSRAALANGDREGAIANANLAVESVCKVVLGVQNAKPGELYRGLIESGLVPQYHKGFLEAFEQHILRCVATMRNQEPGAGHGRGAKEEQPQRELAELAVNLSAVLINFIVQQYTGREKASNAPTDQASAEDIPF